MKNLKLILISASFLALPLSAMADNDDDDHHRHRHHHNYKQYDHKHYKHKHYNHYGYQANAYKKTFWEGNCKITVKYTKRGAYEESRKCKPQYPAYYKPVYVPALAPAPVIYHPSVTIHGTVNLPH